MRSLKIKIAFLSGLVAIVSACSGLDNYSAPNSTIKGKIIDRFSGKPIQTKQPNGIQIQLLEQSYENPTPINFWVKADGTFKNSKIFADKYKIIPINGPFFEPDTAEVNIEGTATVNFTVTPYLELTNVTVTPIKGGDIVKYRIKKSDKSGKIIQRLALASQYPSVSNTVFAKEVSHDLSEQPDKSIINEQFADTLSGLAPDSAGGTVSKAYYIRVAAKTNNANSKFNYSKPIKIIPK